MKASTQSTLIILSTLLVGIVIGTLATGAVTSYRMDRLYALRQEEGFVRAAEEVIVPESEAQRAQIRAVLERTAVRRAELRERYRARKHALLDSMRGELAPFLAPEQQVRLEAWCGSTDRAGAGDALRSRR